MRDLTKQIKAVHIADTLILQCTVCYFTITNNTKKYFYGLRLTIESTAIKINTLKYNENVF